MEQPKSWVDGLGAAYRESLSSIPEGQTKAWVRLAVKYLRLQSGATVLDVPCGMGRLSIPLARLGMQVIAVDIVPEYIEAVRRDAETAGVTLETFIADMRDLPHQNACDAAFNVGSSFGLFDLEVENQRVVDAAFRALRPGGRYMIDTVSRDWLARNFASTGWQQLGSGRLLQERKFDFEKSIAYCQLTFLNGADQQSFAVTFRFYGLHELTEMFRAAGFVDIEHFGDFDEEPASFNSHRLFVIGRKPK